MRHIILLGTGAAMMALSGAAMAQEDRGGADVCVSIKGDTKVDRGDSTCSLDSTSHAVAVNDSDAVAVFGSKATAVNDSTAQSQDDGEARAVNDSDAVATRGGEATAVNDSTARAHGDDCAVRAQNDEEETCP